MFREPSSQQYQFETITLDELVPEDHLICKIDATIDFDVIHDVVANLYRPDNGRPAIDLVRLIKMMLLRYLEVWMTQSHLHTTKSHRIHYKNAKKIRTCNVYDAVILCI